MQHFQTGPRRIDLDELAFPTRDGAGAAGEDATSALMAAWQGMSDDERWVVVVEHWATSARARREGLDRLHAMNTQWAIASGVLLVAAVLFTWACLRWHYTRSRASRAPVAPR